MERQSWKSQEAALKKQVMESSCVVTVHNWQQSANQAIKRTSLKRCVENNQSTNQSTNQSINKAINQSIHQSINQSINQSIDQLMTKMVSAHQTVNVAKCTSVFVPELAHRLSSTC